MVHVELGLGAMAFNKAERSSLLQLKPITFPPRHLWSVQCIHES
jgi:hypothetical protein